MSRKFCTRSAGSKMRIWRQELRDDHGRIIKKATAATRVTAPMRARRTVKREEGEEGGTGSPVAAGQLSENAPFSLDLDPVRQDLHVLLRPLLLDRRLLGLLLLVLRLLRLGVPFDLRAGHRQ